MALADTVSNLLDRVGVAYTFEAAPSASTYDPATGDHHDLPASYPVTGSPPQAFDTRLVDNDIVRRDDLLVYVAGQGLAFTPANGMVVTGSDLPAQMLVHRIQTFKTKDGAIAYAIHLRA